MNTYNKLFLASFVTAIGVAAIAVPASVEAAKSFSDVPAKHVYSKEISSMTEMGIINGYPDGTFRPEEKITRKHAAALISRAFDTLPTEKEHASKKTNDVSEKNAYKADIDKVVKAGIIVTDAKGNFRPNDPITRGEMAHALAKAYQLDKAELTGPDAPFIEKAQMKYYNSANLLYKAGITTGYGGKEFKEKDSLSRAHYAVFMYRAATLTKPEAKPEPTKPPTEDPLAQFDTSTFAPDNKELADMYANAKVPAGKNAADLSAENRQQAKAWQYSVSSVVFRESIRSLRVESSAETLYTAFMRVGLSKEEIKIMTKKAMSGEVITGKSNSGQHYYMYFTFDDSKLVTGFEDTSRK